MSRRPGFCAALQCRKPVDPEYRVWEPVERKTRRYCSARCRELEESRLLIEFLKPAKRKKK